MELNAQLPAAAWTTFSDRTIYHGRRVCHAKKPACGACFLAQLCPSYGTARRTRWPPQLIVGPERPHLLALVGLAETRVSATADGRRSRSARRPVGRLARDEPASPDWSAPGSCAGSTEPTVTDLLPRPLGSVAPAWPARSAC